MRLKTLIAILILTASTVGFAGDTGIKAAVLYLIDQEPGHIKKGDQTWAQKIEEAIVKAAREYHHDPYLLTAMASIESDFLPVVLSGKKKGKAGEIGILQCGRDCARKCPHFMDTVEGQALCGAAWLKKAMDFCRGKGGKHSDEWAGLAYYASGKYCNPPPEARSHPNGLTYRQKANKRIRLRDRLKNRFAR